MAITSFGAGCMIRQTKGRTTINASVMAMLKVVNNVSVIGIRPMVFSIGLPLVAATSGTEPEKPPCQVMKPM